jgi:CubicO group peptidase (beta-lactamase class C family)
MNDQVSPVTARRLLARLAGFQATGRLPSVVAGVLRDGGLAWTAGYGDVPGQSQEVQAIDVQYRIGSITKTFTAVLVHQLVRDGRLAMDDTVGSVLGDVGYADRTVRSLLAHDSGMQAEPAGDWWERSAGGSFAELAAANDGSGAVFPPMQQFHYSNLGFALLGEIASRLLGAPWWDCVRGQVLEPLGMTRTTYHPERPAAQGWSVHPYAGTLTPEPATDTGAMAPAGQAWSTLRDLATYAQFLLDGHPDVLDLDVLLSAAHPQSGDREDGLGHAYALGFQLYAGGSGMLVGHGGSMPGFLAICLVDRDRGTGCVGLANATTGMVTADLARDLLADLEASEPSVPQPWVPNPEVPPLLVDVLGVWHWGNTPFVFTLEGDEVVARKDGEDKWRFVVRDGRVLGSYGYQAGEELRVVRRPDGTVSHLDAATFVLTRHPYDASAPIPGGAPE